ncbi:MAG: hypothetical protein K1X82_03240 [Bacteroidia bacterium]|nr:hypothetical protein [Bacteroidia bacterium]
MKRALLTTLTLIVVLLLTNQRSFSQCTTGCTVTISTNTTSYSVPSGATVCIASGVTVGTLSNVTSGKTVINCGTVNSFSIGGGIIQNYGTMKTTAGLNSGTLNNNAGGTINITANLAFGSGLVFTNSGTFSASGNITLNSSSTFNAGGTVSIGGNLVVKGTMVVNTSISNISGSITVNSGGIIRGGTNSCNRICATGNISNSGTIGGGSYALVVCKALNSGSVTSPAVVSTATGEPTNSPTSLSLSLSSSSSNGTFTAAAAGSAAATGYLVLRRIGSAVTDVPVDGTTYSVGNTIGSSTVVSVNNTATTTFSDNISTCGTYYYAVFSLRGAGNCLDYKTSSPLTGSISTIPTVTSTTPGSGCGTGSVTLGATASNGTLSWYAASTGGSSLGTGTSFSTPSISSTTTYYVDATNAGCTSASRTAVTATINPSATISSSSGASRCGTGTLTLTATASNGTATLNWYAASSGGSSLGTGTSYTTPSISSTTTYYVSATLGSCTSARTAVVATVNAIPTISTATSASRCDAGTVSLSAAASNGTATINWYAASSGGSSFATGTTYTTPSLSTTTTYYLDATLNGCTTASRTAITATINATPSISTSTGGSRCGTGTVTLSATASNGSATLNWYAASSGGSSLGTGTSFTTPSISTTTTYYVIPTLNSCTPASRTAVVATVNSIPTISSTTGAARCGAGTVSLAAAASNGTATINWYAASSGGSSLGAGTSFTTPSISSTTLYYVDATLNGCTTASRSSVTATIDASPTVSNAGSSISQCNTSAFVMAANVPSVGTGAWSVVSGSPTISNSASATSAVTLAAGNTATLRWTISNGSCPASASTVTITNSSLGTTATAGTTTAQCNNGLFTATGNIPLVGVGSWSLVSGSATIALPAVNITTVSGVPVGTAAVVRWTITNGACSTGANVTFTNDASPTTSAAGSNITQCNTSTFVMAANTPVVGTGLWSVASGTATIATPSSPTSNITVAAGATATLRWTISNGSCASSQSTVVLTNSAVPTTSNAGTDLNNCNNGSFTLAGNSPSVGTGAWSVVSGTATITTPSSRTSGVTGVPVGSSATLAWTITNGACTSTDNVVLTNFATPTTSNAGAAIYNCNNTVFTMAANTPTVGTGSWSVVSGSATIATPSSPTSSVTLTSGTTATLRWTISNGPCTASTSNVVITNVIISSSISGTNISCPGGSNGTITLSSVANGLAPYTYLWSNGSTSQNQSGIVAGAYTVTITDSRGCTGTNNITLTQPNVIAGSATVTNATCGWCSDGSATVSASGGTGPYTYLWDNGSTSTSRSGMAVGTYPVTITDSRGCTNTYNVVVRGPIAASITSGSSCSANAGTATATGVGGFPPYTYSWSTGSTSQTISNLAAGTYTVTVRDATNATATQSVTITNTVVNLSVSPSTSTICLGGSVNITASGSSFYSWSPSTGLSNASISNPVATPTVSTTYTLTGSTTTANLVTNGDFSSGNTGFTSDYIYVSPAANAASSGGNTGLWPEGDYAITNNAVTYHPHFSGTGHGGSGNCMVINGAPASGAEIWRQNISVTPNTDYTFSTWISSVVASSPAQLRFGINNVVQGAVITSPNTTGSWVQFSTTWNSGSNTSAEIAIVNNNTVLSGNDFALDDIMFTTQCSASGTVAITVNNPPAITTHPNDAAACAGDSKTFTVAATGFGPLSYQWQVSTNGGGSYSNISNGGNYSNATTASLTVSGITTALNSYKYRCVVTGGCSPTATSNAATLTVTAIPTITSVTNGQVCFSGTVSLAAVASNGSATINWYAASTGGSSLGTGSSFTTPSISSTTNYYVDATLNGCTTASRTLVVATVIAMPSFTSTTPASRCGSGSVVLGAAATAGTINWYAASAGGSSLIAGTSYTTPSLSSTTTYYVDATTSGCTSSPRVSVVATINTIPTITGTTPASACGTSSVALAATASGGTINWYSASTGGSSLGSGATFNTPSLATTTTYYVDATLGSCTSTSRTAVTATINPIPSISSATSASRCGNGTVNLTAAASTGTINWYAASSGGSSLGTGTTYTTPSLSTTTTYYVDATASGCTTGSRTAVTATVIAVPTITASTPGSNCGPGTVSLGATASVGTVQWFAAASGGSALASGNSYTTPLISTNTTYYAGADNSGCTTASRTAVLATIYTIPTVTATTPGSNCGTGTVNLGATASAGTLNWYAASSGGASLGSGTSFTTPSISSSTTYYVDATANGCTTGSRSSVLATINAIPSITSTTAGSRCGSGTVSLSAASSAGTISWFAASTGGSALGTGTSFTTPSLSSTTTYYVSATANGCTTASRSSVTATINTALGIVTQPTAPSLCLGNNATIAVVAVGLLPSYQWQVSTNGGSTFSDIPNGGVYSLATTPALLITGATTAMNNYQYRCVVTSAGCGTGATTNAVTMTVQNPSLGLTGYSPQAGDYFWTGLSSIGWDLPGNWLSFDGVNWLLPSILPATTNNVVIRTGGVGNACISGSNQPTIYATSFAKKLFIEAGATLTVSGSNVLKVSNDWTNNGTFVPSTGTVEFNGTGNQTVITGGVGVGKQFYNVSIKTPNDRRLIVPSGQEMKVLGSVTVQP